jgi:hypothetical protein
MAKKNAPKQGDGLSSDTFEPVTSANSTEEGDPDGSKETGVEVKQGAFLKKVDFKKFKVEGLHGGFGDVVFGDDYVTQGPVSAETLAKLQETFGDAVEEIKGKKGKE